MKTLTLFSVAMLLCCGNSFAANAKKADASDLLQKAKDAFLNYNPAEARSAISEARAAIKRVRKKNNAAISALADSIEQQVDRMARMIQRVEKITVIDSIAVNRDDFFEYYRLSRDAGSILPPSTMPEEFGVADKTTVYIPENGRYMLWGSDSGIMSSERFTDGTWDTPQPAGQQLNCGGIANYPFMMADGVTLYYATKGEDSLGGYDIYFSRRDDSGKFLTPQNVGMPYNSPYDDYLLAIDEITGAGWWATDRNQIPDKVTVYVFIPSEMRINYPVDSPDLADRASLRNWRDTREDNSGRIADVMSRIENSETASADNTPDFELSLPDGRVYTRWSDFHSDKARMFMEQYVDALEEDAADRRILEDLRAKFRAGDHKTAERIISLEKKTESSGASLKAMINRVIQAELPDSE
ncbi:MAG: hypothetical protein K2H33_04315 [Muribaculaceae bacterium]|nr:hypothetical protein [Muribaculaceae bacterium]